MAPVDAFDQNINQNRLAESYLNRPLYYNTYLYILLIEEKIILFKFPIFNKIPNTEKGLN